MMAFEVRLNGKRLYTIGGGDGMIAAQVLWNRRKALDGDEIHETLWLRCSGIESLPDFGHSHENWWPMPDIKPGDEITIKPIEADSCDPPSERRLVDLRT